MAEISDRLRESIITAEGHKYTGDLRNHIGVAGLVLEGTGSMIYNNGDRYTGDWKLNERSGHGTLQYADGGVYEGEWEHDQRHGCGELMLPNGDHYQGSFFKGERKGMGTESIASTGEKYTGSFSANMRNGRGILELANGNVYEGQFVDGVMHGHGTMRFPNKDEYVGQFSNNAMHGKGTLYFENGDKYEGQYATGVRVGGMLLKKDGTTFVAEFTEDGRVSRLVDAKSGVEIGISDAAVEKGAQEDDSAVQGTEWKDGMGNITYANGDKYSGQFADNQRHGQGTMEYACGDVYTGRWEKNQRHGEGKMVWKQIKDFNGWYTGWRYIGNWANDVFSGHGQLWYDVDGGHYKGLWVEGRRQGLGKEEVAGDTYTGDFRNGERHGSGILKTREGHVFTGSFADGVCKDENATVVYALPEGATETFVGAVEGRKREGEGHMTYANGDVYDGEFKDDRRHGVGLMTFRNGDYYQGQWQNDEMHGNGTMTYADGDVYDGRMQKNLKHGAGLWTDATTNIVTKVTYAQNVLVNKLPVEKSASS